MALSRVLISPLPQPNKRSLQPHHQQGRTEQSKPRDTSRVSRAFSGTNQRHTFFSRQLTTVHLSPRALLPPVPSNLIQEIATRRQPLPGVRTSGPPTPALQQFSSPAHRTPGRGLQLPQLQPQELPKPSPHPGRAHRGCLFLLCRHRPAPKRLQASSFPAGVLQRGLWDSHRVSKPVRRVVSPAGRAAAAATVALATAGPVVCPLHGFPGSGHPGAS